MKNKYPRYARFIPDKDFFTGEDEDLYLVIENEDQEEDLSNELVGILPYVVEFTYVDKSRQIKGSIDSWHISCVECAPISWQKLVKPQGAR